MTRLRPIACVISALNLLGGCTPPDPAPEPCVIDALGCGAALRFELDEACLLEEPLRVTLGHGTDGFYAFELDEMPILDRSLSGGQGANVGHIPLALRIDNPDADHRSFQVEFFFDESQDDGGSGGSGGMQAAQSPSWLVSESRRVVLGEANMRHGEGGSLEQWGINLILGCPECVAGPARLRVSVRDNCDRRAEEQHLFDW